MQVSRFNPSSNCTSINKDQERKFKNSITIKGGNDKRAVIEKFPKTEQNDFELNEVFGLKSDQGRRIIIDQNERKKSQ